MTPYYDEGGITIYHGDCREVMPLLVADVVVTDPPYDQNGEWIVGVATRLAVFGYPEMLIGWCVTAARVPDEWVTWWPSTPKPVSGGRKLPALTECIAVFGDTPGARDLRRKRTGSSDRFLRSVTEARGHSDMARLGDVWTDPAPAVGFNAHLRLHPNQKPLSVMTKLIQLCTDPSEVVIDPFMGSGTTLRAAKDLSRKAIGIEIEEEYCEIAVNRLAQGVLEFG